MTDNIVVPPIAVLPGVIATPRKRPAPLQIWPAIPLLRAEFPLRPAVWAGALAREPCADAGQVETMTALAPHDGTLVPGELRPWRRPLVRGLADGAHVLVDRVVEGERRHGPRTPPDVPGPLGHGVVALDPHPEAGRVRRRLLPQRVGDVPPGPRGVARRLAVA